MGAISEYKKYYKKFNKEFFHGELPEVDIRIEKLKDKKAVGEFIYTAALKHQDGKKEKFFDIKKAVFNKRATPAQQDEWADIIADAYIAMPKDAHGKGKYYWASILLHEMCHVYQRLVSDSMEQADHGHDFRKKVDEINKKSKNEWRVGYEELDAKLVSDEPINERPEDLEERKNVRFTQLFKMKETDDWDEEMYERERDGEPTECCRCGADCTDGGSIIHGDVYCPSCASRFSDYDD
jgi:hypothetical protein